MLDKDFEGSKIMKKLTEKELSKISGGFHKEKSYFDPTVNLFGTPITSYIPRLKKYLKKHHWHF